MIEGVGMSKPKSMQIRWDGTTLRGPKIKQTTHK